MLGSAGGPRQALPMLGADTFLIVNGDTLTDVDLAGSRGAHAASGALVTLALVPNREFNALRRRAPRRRRPRDRLRAARARRRKARITSSACRSSTAAVFDSVPPGEPASSIGGVYDALIAAQPGAVRGFVCDAAFWDVGTVEDYWRTSNAFMPTRGRRRAQAQDAAPRIDAVRARHAVDSVGRCGGRSRARWSTSASSPTASAWRPAAPIGAAVLVRDRQTAASPPMPMRVRGQLSARTSHAPNNARTDQRRSCAERIDRYLRRRAASAGPNPRVVPLTGDASDRRYFRVIPADGPSIVLALHAGPIDFASLPFANVARAAAADPAAGAGDSRPFRRARHPRAAGSRRRDAAGAPRRGVAHRARRAVPRGGRAHRAAAAARRRARVRSRTCRTASRSTSRS